MEHYMPLEAECAVSWLCHQPQNQTTYLQAILTDDVCNDDDDEITTRALSNCTQEMSLKLLVLFRFICLSKQRTKLERTFGSRKVQVLTFNIFQKPKMAQKLR